jgi:hypothetical protein
MPSRGFWGVLSWALLRTILTFPYFAVFAQGTIVNFDLPLTMGITGLSPVDIASSGFDISNVRAQVRLQFVDHGSQWQQGFYYRVIGCSFRWCCSIRCRMGGRRYIGTPSGWTRPGQTYDLINICL